MLLQVDYRLYGLEEATLHPSKRENSFLRIERDIKPASLTGIRRLIKEMSELNRMSLLLTNELLCKTASLYVFLFILHCLFLSLSLLGPTR